MHAAWSAVASAEACVVAAVSAVVQQIASPSAQVGVWHMAPYVRVACVCVACGMWHVHVPSVHTTDVLKLPVSIR